MLTRSLDILIKENMPFGTIVTLAFGFQPRQGLAKVQAKSEDQESHSMLLGV
jgi:hypothetical protein